MVGLGTAADTASALLEEPRILDELGVFVLPCGELGANFHGYRHQSPAFSSPTKGFYDLGGFAALLGPDLDARAMVNCPEVDWRIGYRFAGRMRPILWCNHVDRDSSVGLLYAKLQEHYRA